MARKTEKKVYRRKEVIDEWQDVVFFCSHENFRFLLQTAIADQPYESIVNETDRVNYFGYVKRSIKHLFEDFLLILNFMLNNGSRFVDDYRVCVKLESSLRKNLSGTLNQDFIHCLKFWCLNPGVCFQELLACRSIILTSGTLSPLVSFASELDTTFPITLEADHVIDDSRVWIGTLGRGPSGRTLNGSFKNANSQRFQDDVGSLIIRTCLKVPHGILVFFSSYRMLQNMVDRWKTTRIWNQILDEKQIVVEPKSGQQLESALSSFYSSNTEDNSGSIMLAVYRGKVSEGLDFSDNNARAVWVSHSQQ